MSKKTESPVYGVGAILDHRLEHKRHRQAQLDTEYDRVRPLVEEFFGRAMNGLNEAAEAINARSEALGFKAAVFKRLHLDRGSRMSGTIGVRLTKVEPNPYPINDTNWSLDVDVEVLPGRFQESFTITGRRGSWLDLWEADISTPACNPEGLSLACDGAVVAEKFANWFLLLT